MRLDGGPIVLRGLTARQSDAVAGLLGVRRPVDGTLRVRLEDLDRALQTSAAGAGLAEVLGELGGPLVDRRAAGARREAARRRAFDELGAHPAVAGEPRLSGWLETVRGSGLAKRLAGGAEAHALRCALDALAAVQRTAGAVLRLPVLAAEVTGDAHGLDRGRPAGTLAVHALSRLAGDPFPRDAAGWRRTWDRVGVACDDLSCDVLVSNLPGWPDEPLRLTLRQVSGWDPPAGAAAPVFVCENPAVLAAAADTMGPGGPPVVCVDGVPSTAGRVVLERLRSAGWALAYHGDFDWRGLAIARVLARAVEVTPWRYGAADYCRAVEAGMGTVELAGKPVDSPWDPALAPAMAAAGVAVYEEQVVGALLDDLGTARRRQQDGASA